MSALKSKLKELIFECESEEEAMDLLKSYRKKNFHLVSKRIIDDSSDAENGSTVALKLIRFKQPSKATNLESVWENFVHQMSDLGVDDAFTSEILKKIRTKEKFWEVHPEDHLRDIVMDARNFIKSEKLSKVLVFVAPEAELLSFLCSYQKSIGSVIKELGIFVMCPEHLKAKVVELRASARVQALSYTKRTRLSQFAKDIDLKVGLVLATPEDFSSFDTKEIEEHAFENRMSLIVSPNAVSREILNIAAPKFIASSYMQDKAIAQILSAININLKHHLPLAFLWNHEQVSSILNPEAQVLKVLDDLFENLDAQHFNNK